MLISASLPVFPTFTITNAKTHELLYSRKLSETKEFYISFIHSVNKVPVYEYYKVIGSEFLVYKTVFFSYGAGMPEANPQYKYELEDGKVIVTNINRAFPKFSVFVGTIANHEIYFEDTHFPLKAIAPEQSSLQFEIKRISLIKKITYILKQEVKHG